MFVGLKMVQRAPIQRRCLSQIQAQNVESETRLVSVLDVRGSKTKITWNAEAT
jgi:hypothetical protein